MLKCDQCWKSALYDVTRGTVSCDNNLSFHVEGPENLPLNVGLDYWMFTFVVIIDPQMITFVS